MTLLEALKKEYETLPEDDVFGKSNHKEQYPAIFEYLETNKMPENIPEEWELFKAIIENYDQVCQDYNIAWYESEDCEYCVNEFEENGMEYTHDFYWDGGTWICEHCGKPN